MDSYWVGSYDVLNCHAFWTCGIPFWVCLCSNVDKRKRWTKNAMHSKLMSQFFKRKELRFVWRETLKKRENYQQ